MEFTDEAIVFPDYESESLVQPDVSDEEIF